jgi:prophage antirepressor-like protein
MSERSITLHYKKALLRIALEADGAWIPAEDLGLAIGLKDPKGPVSKVPEHEKSLRQVGGQGVRMRVLSVEGVQRIAGSVRAPGTLPFLDWFRAQAMPQIALALQDICDAGASVPAAPAGLLLGSAASDTVVTTDVAFDTARSFLYDKLPVRLQVDAKGEILFRAEDVCQALEMGNPRQAIDSHVDPDDVQKLDTIDSLGRTQQANYVNLSGLYALIFGSKKDAARKFKRWVTHDVLPSIQTTGSYDLRGDSAPLIGTQTPAQRLERQASQAALAASLPGSEHAQGAYLKVRQELAQINHASQGLRQMRIEVDFHAGLEQPQASAELPPGLNIPAADKSVMGRIYTLTLTQGVTKPRVRSLLSDEYIVKANLEGIKLLANRCALSDGGWQELEKLAQWKLRVLHNRRENLGR